MYLKGLVALAKKLQRPVLVFDLETTTMRGRSNFGITEFSGLLVKSTGEHLWVSTLVNPENEIDDEVVTLTGITKAMVVKQKNWGHRLAGLMDYWATHAAVVGFNNKGFDCPASIEQNARYGIFTTRFLNALDVKSLAQQIWNISGKLVEVAAQFGEFADGALHRAQADVSLTARVLNRMAESELERVAGSVCPLDWTPAVLKNLDRRVEELFDELVATGQAWHAVDPAQPSNFEGLAAKPEPKAAPVSQTKAATGPRTGAAGTLKDRRRQILLKCLSDNPNVNSVETLKDSLPTADEFPVDKVSSTVEWALAELIDGADVLAVRFLPEALKPWFALHLPTEISAWAQEGKKLKPLLTKLMSLGPPQDIDYITLRAGLASVGETWPTLVQRS